MNFNFSLLASVNQFSQLLSNLNWDLLVIFFFLAVGFFYGISVGKTKMLAVLFSLYISILIFSNLSYLDFFIKDKSILEIFIFRSFTFLVLLVLLIILLSKTVFKTNLKTSKWWQIFVLSFLEVGLLMSAVAQLLPTKDLFVFSSVTEKIFISQDIFFWWLILPLPALFFVVKKQK